MKKIYKVLYTLLSISLVKTLLINLHNFSLKDALKLPIIVGRSVKIDSLGKKVLLL